MNRVIYMIYRAKKPEGGLKKTVYGRNRIVLLAPPCGVGSRLVSPNTYRRYSIRE
jgi:hypothetical protein